MDNRYLEELIKEVHTRGGGILLSLKDKPEAVVLSLSKYNELVSSSKYEVSSGEEAAALTQRNLKPGAVLVTGGAGYIGAHVVRQLVLKGWEVTILDNLSTGTREQVSPEALFVEGDAGDKNLLRDIFAAKPYHAVIHMAASIEVGESVEKPVEYLRNNALCTASLLEAMAEASVHNVIFSSTAAVYGQQTKMPITESAQLNLLNPYAYSKYLAEECIKYYCQFNNFSGIIFRYFNACGTDFDAAIRSKHESHLIPNVLRVANGQQECLTVYGNDYDTFDGTGVRDYVHVLDIARAHVLALDKFQTGTHKVYNIGTGKGYSVEQIVNAASELLNRIIPMQIAPRRTGDAPMTIADNTRLKTDFGFLPEYSDLETIIQTSWKQMSGK